LTPSQSANPVWHASAHTPALQNALAFAVPHALLQSPQLFGSVSTLVHVPEQTTMGVTHVVEHCPPEHVCPASHRVPQPPQLALSVSVFAQYGTPPSKAHAVKLPQVRH
jgi:hypothetical protein